MVPDPQNFGDHMENPVRDAAIHFGAYLQLQNVLAPHPHDRSVGVVSTNQLNDLFVNDYQPKFQTCLVQPKLLATLMQYHVVRKRNKNEKSNRQVRVVLHPHPTQVRPPNSLPRARVYVDQTRVFRDKIHRPEVVNEMQCRLCNVSFLNEESKTQHLASDQHTFRLMYREKRSSFRSAVGGASISIADKNIDDNEVILRIGEQGNIKVVATLGGQPYTEANIIKIFERFELGDVDASPLQFSNGVPIEVDVSAKFEEPGAYLFPLVAKIMSTNKLCLLKDLVFRVESELMDQLAPTGPFQQRKDNVIREMEGPILPGEFLEKESKLVTKVYLGQYEAPGIYNKFLIHKLEKYDNMSREDEDKLNKMLSLLCGLLSYKDALQQVARTNAPYIAPLDKDTYSERFSVLCHLEELQQQRQIRNYDRTDQTLSRRNTKFFLEVPDLSEGRPSVMKGDRVHIQFQHKNDLIYEAIIHEMHGDGLLLGLHREFGEEYKREEERKKRPPLVDVRFTVNRFPFMNMHRALSLMRKHGATGIMFPEKAGRGTYMPPIRVPTLRPWVNPLIATNPEQQTAVQNIVRKTSGTAPYLVFGPPGTGKTVTLVEAITQVWYANTGRAVRQLVCAPSNAACNNIASKLITMLPRTAKIYRLFSLSSEELTVPDELKLHSNFNSSKGCMMMPTIDTIRDKHIVIVTLVSAGRIVTGGGGGDFEYVYIDECGQASEPEAVIAVAGVLTTQRRPSEGQLVLAGDPQQLGPILASQPAKDFGLGISLLERLMNQNTLYKRHETSGYDNNHLTKLVQNFRSHPNILDIPNKLFYHNELKVKGDPAIINCAVGWRELPNPNFPLIFHGVQGIDERESNSPSYFNRQEIDVVLMYIEKLFRNGLPNNYKVKPEDIGIITPYRKQVQKFRKAFDLKRWDIRVGSVEEFQGSEKLIIFISTVRSSMELVEEDYYFKLGFLKNPKRFNVSVTRAKALLVVVGNPNILWHDKQWYQLLQYCYENRAYKGIPYPDGDPPVHAHEHISG